MKTCFLICAFFAIYTLKILSDESNQVIYETSNNENEALSYLGCISLKKWIFSEKTEFDLNELNEMLFNFFNNSYYDHDLKEELLDSISNRNYLIYNSFFCFIYDGEYKHQSLILSKYVYKFSSKKYFVFEKENLIFKSLDNDGHASLIKVKNEKYPYSNCTDKNYSKFRCLNRCFKENGNRLSKYYYDGNETGLIYLNYDQNNESILNQEMNCFNFCKQEECELVFIFKGVSYASKSRIFKAIILVNQFNYFLQSIGLVCLILNFSIYELIFKISNFFFN